MTASRVLLAGYYGFGNAGDEAILASIVAHLRALRPDVTIVAISGDPEATARTHGIEAVFWRDPLALEDAARQADLIAIGGGGLFHDYWGFPADAILTDAHWGLSYYAAPAALALLHGKPLMLYAIGVGPLLSDAGREFTKAVCDAASVITVRDEPSRSELVALGVPSEEIEVTADPAFAFASSASSAEEPPVPPSARRPLLGVALRNWDVGVEPARWEGLVAEALDRFLEGSGGGVLFLPFQQESAAIENDAAVAARVRDRMRRREAASVFPGGSDPSRLAAAIGQCDLVLAMRMHAAIFAALSGVPLVSLDYDPKVSRLMRQIGRSDDAVALSDLDSSDLARRLSETFEERGRYGRHLAERVGALSEAARRTAERAVERLEAGGPTAVVPTPGVVDLLRRTARSQFQAERNLTVALGASERSVASLRQETARQLSEIRERDQRLGQKEREIAALHESLRAAERRVEEEARRGQREAAFLQKQLSDVRNELLSIQTSRYWKAMSIYWAALRRLHRLFGIGRREPRPAAASAVAAPSRPARTKAPARVPAPSPAPLAAESLHDVVCLPIIDWDFRFQRPQQLMTRFAEAGHRVFYVAQNFRQSGPPYEIRKKRENVWEISLAGPARNVYKETLDDAARDALFSALDGLRRDLSLGATALFVQLPFWWPLAKRMRAELGWPVVYDCMDDHAGFSTNRPEMVELERNLLASADLVAASSMLLERRAREANENVLPLPNACDADHFAGLPARPPGRPVVGYYGAIADWFDSDLVADLAEKRPDWDFLLVGSTYTADTSRLSKLSNVTLPGEKPYAEIPKWLARMDVAILPFKRLPLTEATSPVKAYEILAAGKPLVSVPIPEVAPMAPLVRLASTAEEFEQEITEALSEKDPELSARRRAFGRENTWQRRFEKLAPAVAGTFPKASIIVVTYNNLAMNRQCLESLYGRTEWPSFEVVVVDNASEDGTVEYLRETEKRYPNLRVVANDTNRGFAAANNQGLALATGDFLVLLNNDTVVTRGWLTALLRHLACDPKLGLVGPVTNAISNEAKIEVGYEAIEELPAWAEQFTRENDGHTFTIPMLAMFCLAMKREVYASVGPLDERFGLGMFEDDDFNRRAREKGWEIRCARDSFVHHWQKASFRLLGEKKYLALFEENRKKYEEKWGEAWKAEGVEVWNRADLGFYQEQLDAVRGRVAESEGAVIFLPSVGWGIALFQRPHHLARTFARKGWIAIFDSSNAHDDVNGFKEIQPNLYLFRGPQGLLEQIPGALLWAFPYNWHQKDAYPDGAATVYDWIDDLEVFPYDRELLEKNHARALAEATVVGSVARKLHDQAIAIRPDAVYLPNGVEFERFADPEAPLPEDKELRAFRESGKPIAGYYGALAEWFDYELLEKVVRARPDWNFLLIGPMYDQSLRGQPVLKCENVLWLGPRDYHSLPGYLRLFDVATIPFKINNITLATSPLKLYEYFAGGKAVVTTPMPECMAYPEVTIARDASEFAAALDPARELGRDTAYRERARQIGRENSWATRVETVLEALEKRKSAPSPPSARGPEALPSLSGGERAGVRGPASDTRFRGMSSLPGRCNICGEPTRFYYTDPLLFRESLTCAHCLTTSRYRSIARGILNAVRDLAGVDADSLAALSGLSSEKRISVYDTQIPFYGEGNAYPIPDLLGRVSWIDVSTSRFDPRQKRGKRLGGNTTNQNLEALTFPDASFDIALTSDVLEHVRLDDRAHREIRRVLKPGGFHLFTVPHFRDRTTFTRVEVVDPDDPSQDRYLTEREYHGDANSEEGRSLSYRSYGTDLDEKLEALGLKVDYTKDDFPELGIRNTELFSCRRVTAG
jgi:polysaccharide pyruvyl transferase CsaB